MTAGSEKEPEASDNPSRALKSRVTRTTLIASASLVLGAAVLAGYWLFGISELVPKSASSNSLQTVTPSELTNETAMQLLADALARHPVVARVALGDVATVDRNGQAVPLYPQLEQAQIVRLRFCHFPGGGGTANQICLADLTDKAKQYAYTGATPFKTISVGNDDLNPPNRSFVQLALAVPRLQRIREISDRRRSEKSITYTATFELTPLAASFGLSTDALPASLSATAEARASSNGWKIESDGLQQTQANAN